LQDICTYFYWTKKNNIETYNYLDERTTELCSKLKQARMLKLAKGDEELWKLGADSFMGLINAIMESHMQGKFGEEPVELLKKYGFENKNFEDVKFVHYAGHAENLVYNLLALN